MMAVSDEGRLPALDSLRGVAALLVVTFHCWKLGLYTPATGLPAFLWSWTPLNLAVTGRPPVILFFVLSGFVLACSLERPGSATGKFLLRRICRVYLPFVASLAFSVAAYHLTRPQEVSELSSWFNHLAWTEHPSAGLVFKHLLMLGVNGSDSLNPVMWSLVFELRISLIFPLLFIVTRRWPGGMLAASLALHVAAALAIGCSSLQCMPFRGDDILQSFVITGYFVIFFVAGIVLAQNRSGIRARLHALPAVAVAALGGAGIYAMIVPNTDQMGRFIPSDLAFGAGAAVLIALAVGSRRWDRVLNLAALVYLGRISYSLYLTHNIVILAVAHTLYGYVSDVALVLLILAVSVLTADLYFRLIEFPAMRLGQRLTRRPGTARRLAGRDRLSTATSAR